MRQFKSQKREQKSKHSKRLRTTTRERNVMSGSAEQKNETQSSILRFLRKLRDGWGMILLVFLVTLYLTGFFRHASSAEPAENIPSAPEEEPSSEVSTAANSYLLVHTVTGSQNQLPGSLKSSSSTFETAKEESLRDANTLPGAIGLEGSFDEHRDSSAGNITKAVPATPLTPSHVSRGNETKKDDSTNDENATKTVPPPTNSTRETSASDVVQTGQERPQTKKQKKKKKRKRGKRRKTVSSPADAAEDDASGGIARKKRKRRKSKTSKSSDAASSPVIENENSEEERGNIKESSSEGEEKMLNTTARAEQETSQNTSFPLSEIVPRPMDRKMEELQVPGDTGLLADDAVKGYYAKLVKAYLAPFTKGINRSALFDILRRRTYSLSPPGSNKGVQTILFQLIKSKLFLMDPYEVMKNSKPFYKTRVNELIGLLSDVARNGNVPDTEFLVAIHDCVQTVNANHTYRGAVFMESNPTFTIVSCNFSDNIPFPMWEGDPVRGGLRNWDKKMSQYKTSDKTSWAQKMEKAVFRGGNRPSMYFKKKSLADEKCEFAGRSRLSYLGRTNPDIFDVSVSGQWCGMPHMISPLSEADHHQYKYILYAEGNCFWADRLNKQVFGPSAIIKQETPCGQFWEPLLKPMTHYIPTDFFFQDTVDKIKWAKGHDQEVQGMVKNANEFASNFLTEKAIKTYVEILLNEYTKLLNKKVIEPEKGTREVTGR